MTVRIFWRVRNNGKHKRKSKPMSCAGIPHVSMSMTNEFLERKVPSCSSSSILPTGVLGIILGARHSNSLRFCFHIIQNESYPWSMALFGGLQTAECILANISSPFQDIWGWLGDIHQALYACLPHQGREKQETTNLARYFLKDWPGITKDKT